MAVRTIANGGGNWSATGTWVESAVPTAADDVVATATSGNVTIDAASLCRSIDLTNYVGILTHNAFTLTIGDSVAGAGNNALIFPSSGWTYTLVNTATSAVSFASTSATVQAVNGGGKTFGNVTFGSGVSAGSWQLTGAFNQTSNDANAIVTHTRGTLDINGQTVSWARFDSNNSNTRALTLGAANITMTRGTGAAIWTTSTTTGLTLSAGTSTITMSGADANFVTATATYNNLVFSGSSTQVLLGTGTVTLNNLTITGPASAQYGLGLSGINATVTGTLTITGNSLINRVFVKSQTRGTARTLTAAVVSLTNVDFRDITAAGVAAPFTGTSLGDAGSNSNITFTVNSGTTNGAGGVFRYWVGNGGSWSNTAHWSTATGGATGATVPLPQDTVVFDSSSITSGSQTITWDIARASNIDFTNVLNSPTFTNTVSGGVGHSIGGSLILIPGMSVSGANQIEFAGGSDATIDMAGITTGQIAVSINCLATATVSLANDLYMVNGSGNFLVSTGKFTTNNHNMNVNLFQINSSNVNARVITLGTSTIYLTGTSVANQWNVLSTASLTFSGASSTIVLSRSSASTRTFAGGGLTYGTFNYTIDGSTGTLIITGSNTFDTINFVDRSNGRTLTFTINTTNTINNFNPVGSSGKVITINSSTGGTAATLNNSGTDNWVCDWLSIQDITGTGRGKFAGANSTNVSGNTGWIFSPSVGFAEQNNQQGMVQGVKLWQ